MLYILFAACFSLCYCFWWIFNLFYQIAEMFWLEMLDILLPVIVYHWLHTCYIWSRFLYLCW